MRHPTCRCHRAAFIGHVTAVDVELEAGDKGRGIADEVGHSGGDVLGTAKPTRTPSVAQCNTTFLVSARAEPLAAW